MKQSKPRSAPHGSGLGESTAMVLEGEVSSDNEIIMGGEAIVARRGRRGVSSSEWKELSSCARGGICR